MAAEAIGIQEVIGNDPKNIDQQENAGGACNFFQTSQLMEVWLRWRQSWLM
jgi:hypothetical protein